MRKFAVPVIIVLIAAAAFTFSSDGFDTVEVNIVTEDAQYTIFADLADTFGKQTQGLMGRWRLHHHHGMLFVYKDEKPRSFWMKNMRIQIDIIYIDSDHKIVSIHPQVKPCPKNGACPSVPSLEPAKYVLETQGGFTKRFNVDIGDLVQFDLTAKAQ